MTPRKTMKPVHYPTLGFIAIEWIEEYLVHGPGDVEGQPIELDSEFRAFLLRCYEVHPRGTPQAGRRRYRRAFLSRPKGRAKSELAAMIACFEALGECRFDGWRKVGSAYVPVGRPVQSPVVRCFATESGQAGNTYDGVFYMLNNGAVADEFDLDVGLTRTFIGESGEIVAQSSAAASKDGGKDTFDIFDETHLWVLPQYKRLHSTVTRNLIKRKAADGWALETSTMYSPGEDSVAEDTHKSSKSVKTVLFDHKQAPPSVDIKDDEQVLAALDHVYGPAASWMDLQGILAEFRDTQNRESDLRRYFFNEPWTTEEKFCSAAEWDALLDKARRVDSDTRVVLAFDGAYNDDCTALVGVTVEEIPHVFVVGVWKRDPQSPPDWTVDVLDVEEAIREARREHRVVELTADPYRWDRTLKVMEDDGCIVTAFPQTASRMTPATSRFSDVVRTGKMTQDGDADLREHVLNAIMTSDRRGKRLHKESRKSANKIDSAVAVLMGLDRAAFHASDDGYSHAWFLNDLTDEDDAAAGDDGKVSDEPDDRLEELMLGGARRLSQSETTHVRYDPSRGIGVS